MSSPSLLPRQGPPSRGGPPPPSVLELLKVLADNSTYNNWYWFVFTGVIGFFILRNIALLLLGGLPAFAPLTFFESAGNRVARRPAFAGLRMVELVGIVALFIWNVAFLFVNTLPSGFHDSEMASRLKFVVLRAGSTAVQNMPLAFALAGRNNVVSFLTGIPFNHLRPFHKWSGRIAFLMALVHGIGYSVNVSFFGGYKGYTEFIQAEVSQRGIIALCGVSILAGFSAYPFRRYLYEFFLFSHYVGAAAFLAGVYLHRPDRRPWIYACIALWSFDWLVRIGRILVSSLVYPIVHSDCDVPVGRLLAHAELRSGAVVLRIPYAGTWGEGRHVFVTFLDGKLAGRPWRWLERHPWSVANISINSSVPSLVEKGASPGATDVFNEREMMLIIRPKGGITKDLYRLVDRNGGANVPLSVVVDGPYGHGVDARKYQRVVLIAGGSGITHVLSVLLQLVRRARDGTSGHTTHVDLMWAVQHLDHLSWISSNLNAAFKALPSSCAVDFSITVFVTRPIEARSLPSTGHRQVPTGYVANTNQNSTSPSANPSIAGNIGGMSESKARSMSMSQSGHGHDNFDAEKDRDQDGRKLKSGAKMGGGVYRRAGGINLLDPEVERITSVELGRPDARELLEEATRATDGAVYVCACGPDGLARDVSRAAAAVTHPGKTDGSGRGFVRIDVAKFTT